MNRHFALICCLRMIFSENRFPLFRIMLLAQFFAGIAAGRYKALRDNQ
jgi:hypothetical protein